MKWRDLSWRKKPFSNAHTAGLITFERFEIKCPKWKKYCGLLITITIITLKKKKNFWFGKLFQLFFFLKTVIATAYAQHRKGSGQCEKKKVMKSPGVTWLLAAHTLCLLVCLWNWFSLCWHQGDHDNSVMLGLESRCWSCSCCWALPPATTSLIGRCCGCYTKIKGPTPLIFQLNALSSPFLPGSPLQRPFKYVFSKDDVFFSLCVYGAKSFIFEAFPYLIFISNFLE